MTLRGGRDSQIALDNPVRKIEGVRSDIHSRHLVCALLLVAVLATPVICVHAASAGRLDSQATEMGSWMRGAPMPTERGEVGAAAVDGRIYVVGAYSGATDANEAYDPVPASWETLAPLPRALNHVCAVAVGYTLFVVGGFDPATGNRPVDSTYAFDPATNTWSPRAPMPTPRGALACAAGGETIFAIGGATPAA